MDQTPPKKAPNNSRNYVITSVELNYLTLRLVTELIKQGEIPDIMIGLWRGGATFGPMIHEAYKLAGHCIDHFPLKTMSYTDEKIQQKKVIVQDLDEYVIEKINNGTYKKILIIDDILDSGNTIIALIEHIKSKVKNVDLDFCVGVIWLKADKNKYKGRIVAARCTTGLFRSFNDPLVTALEKLNIDSPWVVFPHELSDMKSFDFGPSRFDSFLLSESRRMCYCLKYNVDTFYVSEENYHQTIFILIQNGYISSAHLAYVNKKSFQYWKDQYIPYIHQNRTFKINNKIVDQKSILQTPLSSTYKSFDYLDVNSLGFVSGIRLGYGQKSKKSILTFDIKFCDEKDSDKEEWNEWFGKPKKGVKYYITNSF